MAGSKLFEARGNTTWVLAWAGLAGLVSLLTVILWAQQSPMKAAEPNDAHTTTPPASTPPDPNRPAAALVPTDTEAVVYRHEC